MNPDRFSHERRDLLKTGVLLACSSAFGAASKKYNCDRWPCCSGTLPMLAADYRISAFFSDARGLYVNLYIPGRVDWKQAGAACRLSLASDYPYASTVTITLQVSQPNSFALRFRIPAWAIGASVLVNGKRSSAAVVPGTFVSIEREWRSGDCIELDLPLRMRLQAIDEHNPGIAALCAGWLVLMRLLDDARANTSALPKATLLSARCTGSDKHLWAAGDGAHTFDLRAFADIGTQQYSVYQNIVK